MVEQQGNVRTAGHRDAGVLQRNEFRVAPFVHLGVTVGIGEGRTVFDECECVALKGGFHVSGSLGVAELCIQSENNLVREEGASAS
jgi:hypothetical protein